MRNHSQFYIMKAYHLTSSGRKLGLRKIVRDEPDCTLLIAERLVNGRFVPVFIIGARADYGVSPGDKTTYTLDTGNGYRNDGEQLNIEHYLQIKNGKVIESDGKAHKTGELPDVEARYTFVMK